MYLVRTLSSIVLDFISIRYVPMDLLLTLCSPELSPGQKLHKENMHTIALEMLLSLFGLSMLVFVLGRPLTCVEHD